MIQKADPAIIVIFGASGDLTQRKLVPALHSLACEELLHPQTRIVGVARSEFSAEGFHEHLYEGVADHARLEPDTCDLWQKFAERYTYISSGYDDAETYERLKEHLAELETEYEIGGNYLFYLATPPFLYAPIVAQLGAAELNTSDEGWRRLIVEKPFGHDLESARQFNEQIYAVFEESQVYRIDHYLGKETVQNILTFRFANAIFEPLWSRKYVDHVEITVAESVLVGQRAGYYDDAGVLRDMFQNHLLQLLTLMAMEPPSAFNARVLRDEKVKVLHAVRQAGPDDLVLGQYEGYLQEDDVAADSRTPTYAALRLYIDNWRWKDVPFYMRSGKGLTAKVTEITMQFKHVPHLLFPENVDLTPNRLSLCSQPEEAIHLHFATKMPGAGMRVKPVDMDFHYAQDFGDTALPEAYERLLLDAMQGDAALFTRGDEIELAWQLIDPLTELELTPHTYPQGSWGPEQADDLIAVENCSWHCGCLDSSDD